MPDYNSSKLYLFSLSLNFLSRFHSFILSTFSLSPSSDCLDDCFFSHTYNSSEKLSLLSLSLDFLSRFHSFILSTFSLSPSSDRLDACFFLTHTPLELNQKSMLSMASQYLIKQSLCPRWQVMHFTVLTHSLRQSLSLFLSLSLSLSLSHTHAIHCNNL